MSPQRKYKAAIIGVGKAGGGGPKGGGHAIGYTHAEMFQTDPRVQLVAGADPNPQNLSAFAEKFTVPLLYPLAEAMFTNITPDIVSIGTYVGLHRELIETAARAGVKGIVCEKPFLASVPQCRAVERIARETGVKIVVAHVRRYRPAFIRARELFNDGTIGKPVACMGGIQDWDLSEWGSHWLDMFRFLNQDREVRHVFGQARVRDTRGYGHAMEEHAVAYFEFVDGVRGILDGGRSLANLADMTLMLVGTEGTIAIEGEKKLTIHNRAGQKVEEHPLTRQGDHWVGLWAGMLDDLIKWIEGGREPDLGLTNMLKTSELNLAAYISACCCDRVDLPLEETLDEWPLEELARRCRR